MCNLKCRKSNFDTNSDECFLSSLSGTFLLADSVIIHCCHVSFYNDLTGVGGGYCFLHLRNRFWNRWPDSMSDHDSSCKCVSQYDPSICSEAIHPRRLGKIVTPTTFYVMTFFHLPQKSGKWKLVLLSFESAKWWNSCVKRTEFSR